MTSTATEVAVFVTPLYSAAHKAACYVLDIDDCRVLLDCGWSDAFDVSIVQQLQAIAASSLHLVAALAQALGQTLAGRLGD